MGILSVRGRYTNCKEAYEANKRSDASLIYSDAVMVEEFSIELSVGDQWAEDISKEMAVMYAIENGAISIKPQASVVLEVKENIHVPFNMYGLVLQTGSIFLEQGILIGSGKIEPSFDGKLRLLVYNTSKTKRTLLKGQKIASAIFLRTDKTINASIYNNNRASIERNRGNRDKIREFFLGDKKFTINLFAHIVTSSLTATIITYALTKSVEAENTSQKVSSDKQFEAPATDSGKVEMTSP